MHYRKDIYTEYNDFLWIEKTYSINEDVIRRDYTANAIYYNIFNNKYIDPLNGIVDINNWIINAIWNFEKRIKEDPLRIIRIYKLIIKYNFKMSNEIIEWLKNNLLLLSRVHYIKWLNFIFELIKNDLFFNFYNLYWYYNWNKLLSFNWMEKSINLKIIMQEILGIKAKDLNNINSAILLYEWVNKDINILTYFEIENKYSAQQIKSLFLYYEKFIDNYNKYHISMNKDNNKNMLHNLWNFIFNNETNLFKSKNDYILFFDLLYKLWKIDGSDFLLLNRFFKKNSIIFKSHIHINNKMIEYIKSLWYKNINQWLFDIYIKNNIII